MKKHEILWEDKRLNHFWDILEIQYLQGFNNFCKEIQNIWTLQICHITVMRLSLNYVMIYSEIETID